MEAKMEKISLMLFLLLSVFYISCSSCDGEDPSVILRNNGTAKADIQIKTSGGNTENINNIMQGGVSDKRFFAPGEIVFTIAIQGVNDPVVYNLITTSCEDYIVTINPDNTVSANGTNRD